MSSPSVLTPVALPTIVDDFYDPGEVDALFGVVKQHGPWDTILAHHFTSTEEYLSVSGAKDSAGTGNRALSDFISPSFRGYLADDGIVLYPELHDLYFGRKLLDPVLAMHNAKYGFASHMLFNVGVPSHSFDAGHFDSPSFRGVGIHNSPIWLISVMHKSTLFRKWEVKTGQMITYFYSSGPDGGFTYWPEGPDADPKRLVPPFWNTCMLADNSNMFHRRESGGPVAERDHPDIRLESKFGYDGDDLWSIRNADKVIGRYRTDQLRFLFHHTSLVFDDLAAVRQYLDHTDDLTHEKVIDILIDDLRTRGVEFTDPTDPLHDGEFLAVLNATYATAPARYPADAPMPVRGAA